MKTEFIEKKAFPLRQNEKLLICICILQEKSLMPSKGKKLLPCSPVSCVKEAACSKSKGSQRKMACRRSKQFTWFIDSCLHHMTDLKATSELSVQYVELTRDIEMAALMSFPIKKIGKFGTVFYGLQYQ